MKISAYAPANISCIFKSYIGKDALHTGSTGIGFTLNKGVTVEVSSSEITEVFFNDKKIHFPTVESVVNVIASAAKQSQKSKEIAASTLSPRNDGFKISLTSPLPLGCGFGLSGASALATAYGLNVLLNLKKTHLELAKVAHIAEVENSTGLGDVTNQYFGGCCLKAKPSYLFKVEAIPLVGTSVYVKVFDRLDTKSVIDDKTMVRRINKAADMAMSKITYKSNAFPSFWGAKRLQNQTKKDSGQGPIKSNQARMTDKNNLLTHILTISKQFANESGLLRNEEVIQTISEIENRGGHASMIMLGNAVFSDIDFPGATPFLISGNKTKLL